MAHSPNFVTTESRLPSAVHCNEVTADLCPGTATLACSSTCCSMGRMTVWKALFFRGFVMPRVTRRPPPAATIPSSGETLVPISTPAASAPNAMVATGTGLGATTSTSLSTTTGPSFISFFQRVSIFSPGRVHTTFHWEARSAAVPLFDGLSLHLGFSGALGPPAFSCSGFTPADFVRTASSRGRSFTGRGTIAASTPARYDTSAFLSAARSLQMGLLPASLKSSRTKSRLSPVLYWSQSLRSTSSASSER